jgi:hypothetical protein
MQEPTSITAGEAIGASQWGYISWAGRDEGHPPMSKDQEKACSVAFGQPHWAEPNAGTLMAIARQFASEGALGRRRTAPIAISTKPTQMIEGECCL